MSELRRRIFAGVGSPDETPSSSREHSPAPGSGLDGKDYKVVPVKRLEKLKKNRNWHYKRRTFWVFTLGGLLGILVGGFFFARSNGGLDNLAEMVGMKDINFDMILDVLPAGLIKDVQDIQVGDALPCVVHTHALIWTKVGSP